MYIPKHFRQEDQAEIKSFIEANNFGIVLSSRADDIVGTHLPFILEDNEDDSYFIKTHLAAANPQLKHWTAKKDCMIIFNGPHAYVSPSLYESKQQVPTWNFIAVHVYGQIEIIDDFEAKKILLEESIMSFEAAYMKQWKTLDVKYRDRLIHGMTGLNITIDKIDAKYKLSQNKPDGVRKNVANHFKEDGNSISDYME